MTAPDEALTVTILGCGSSAGVPRPAQGWGDCDPADPRNRRRRCSLLVERASPSGVTRVLIDTSPDLREQLISAGVDTLDAVFFTHEHADQTHGIDDLRPLVQHMHRRIPCYFNASAARDIVTRFGYCFTRPPGSSYPPILIEHRIEAGEAVTVAGEGGALAVTAFEVAHGDAGALGYRIGGLAYTPDISDIPEQSMPLLQGLELWIVDALRYKPHPSHFSVGNALDWIARMKPARAILTNMNSDIDYAVLRTRLPAHVMPAYDGMAVTVTAAAVG
ncbi:MAG: MBL fold metallo-hydrolase [Xanthobacteraceae bacterium]|nr:MAG: MBL fold metallo-hydrolase [Xanthobacteraceae bacterium]